jgi:hypothetical protein
MYDTARDTLDALRAGPEVLQGLLFGVTEEQARAARGGDENWSVVEVVCHLRDAEERALERMRAMRDEQNPLLAAYDQDEWARERRYSDANLQEAFEAFSRLRAQFVADLEALSTSDWERPGQHAEAGQITILNHALHLAAHDAIHAAQIARQLAAAR